MEGDMGVYLYVLPVLSYYFNSQYSFLLGTYYNICFGYVLNIFLGGPKAKNVRMYHAVTATVCVTAKRPGGLTIGHPYGTQSLEFTLERGLHPIKKEC